MTAEATELADLTQAVDGILATNLTQVDDARLDHVLDRLFAMHQGNEYARATIHPAIEYVIGEQSRRLGEWLVGRGC